MEQEGKNSGFVWHAYHSCLMSYCEDYNHRVESIKCDKPANEIATRLEHFQFVKGQLPEEFEGACKNYAAISPLLNKHKRVIAELHAKECPNCTWNGSELVFPKHRLRAVINWLKRTLTAE